jgi:hypothetical protein
LGVRRYARFRHWSLPVSDAYRDPVHGEMYADAPAAADASASPDSGTSSVVTDVKMIIDMHSGTESVSSCGRIKS